MEALTLIASLPDSWKEHVRCRSPWYQHITFLFFLCCVRLSVGFLPFGGHVFLHLCLRLREKIAAEFRSTLSTSGVLKRGECV